ncbi:MAG: hypothetical protein ACKPI5_04640 [Dolichospermum sp.]
MSVVEAARVMEQAPLFVAVASEVASCFGDAPPRIEDGTSLQITCAAALILPTGQYAAWCLHRTEERLAACDINELGMMLKNHVAAMDEVWVECHTRVINALGLTNEEVASMVDPALNAPKAKSQAHVLVYRLSQADQIKTEFRERLEQAIAQKENDAWDYFANTFGDYMSGVRQTLVGSIKTACSATPPSDPRDALIKYGSEAYAMLSEDPEDKSPSMVMQVHAAWASLKVAVRVVEEATEAKLMGFEGMLTKRKDRKELRAKAKDAMGFVVALVALFSAGAARDNEGRCLRQGPSRLEEGRPGYRRSPRAHAGARGVAQGDRRRRGPGADPPQGRQGRGRRGGGGDPGPALLTPAMHSGRHAHQWT